MACREWGTDLTDWALDELSPLKTKQLEQHIQECAECGRAAERLRGVRQTLMSSLTDRPMPSHLMFLEEKPKRAFADLWAALLRTATLSAAAAAIFLALVSAGFRYGGSRLFPATTAVETSLTRTQLQAYVAQAVAEQAAVQSKELDATTKTLASNLRQQQMGDMARLAQQLQYLEMAQNAVWKETQRQNEVINLVSQNR